LSEYTGSKYVIPCANGTDALQIAYMALGLQPGDEVIMPTFNYVASAEAAALLGLKPVFADVHEGSFNINETEIENRITAKTRAIVAVHLFGQAANMKAIMNIAVNHNLKLIEDNAQSLGCEVIDSKGNKVRTGTVGHISINSFFPTKNLGCFGDGGSIQTNDPKLAANADIISKHGQKQKYAYETIGCNSRLDTIQAAILRVKLRKLDEYIQARTKAGKVYDQLLSSTSDTILPERDKFSTHTFNQYVIRINNRETVREKLKNAGIPTMVYYPSPLHLQKAYSILDYQKGDFPIAEKLCKEVLALPIHTELTFEEQKYITDHLIKALREI
jgi:UDP-2-acetamido-2-deoxy-ribo-hexuluronate aminotransferase